MEARKLSPPKPQKQGELHDTDDEDSEKEHELPSFLKPEEEPPVKPEIDPNQAAIELEKKNS